MRLVTVLLLGLALLSSPPPAPAAQARRTLTEQEKIIHVLNRLGYGPRPGDIEKVKKLGVRAYIEQQLHPESIPDAASDAKLRANKLVGVVNDKLDLVVAREGVIARGNTMRRDDSTDEKPMPPVALQASRPEPKPLAEPTLTADARAMRETLRIEAPDEGDPTRARLIRGVYSERQLLEVMVDFWSNHFNMARVKGEGRVSYEEGVVRKNAFGKFEDLLKATAQHPTMLVYLDNWRSSAPRNVIDQRLNAAMQSATSGQDRRALRDMSASYQNLKGLNENYGRELLELHTLGVDGGYTQQDVIQVAKALTGWTITEWDETGNRVQDQFLFNPILHESGDKIVLGKTIKSSGVQEGMEILTMLAHHPSTAHHIATKLVRRFVADEPPADIVKAAEQTFLKSDGDIREVLKTILTHPSFFAPEYFQAKFKTPLELVFSALRVTQSEIDFPPVPRRQAQAAPIGFQAFLQDMGEPLYGRLTPDGYPDVAVAWLDSNALLKRMDFASAFSVGRMPEAKLNLEAARPLMRDLKLPEPNTAQENQIRAQMQQAAAQRNAANQAAAATQVPSMMDAGASKTDKAAEFSQEAIAVAYALGSPQFQKR